MFCSKCGTKVPDDSLFCGHCGAALKGNDVAAPVYQEAQATVSGSTTNKVLSSKAGFIGAAVVLVLLVAIFINANSCSSSETIEIELTGMAAHANSWTVWDEASTGGTLQLYSSGNARLKVSSDSRTIYCDWEIDSNGNVVLEDTSGESITLQYTDSGGTETLSYGGYTFVLS